MRVGKADGEEAKMGVVVVVEVVVKNLAKKNPVAHTCNSHETEGDGF